jgi:PPOX class probable F420-dependent enzyme
MWSLKAAQGRGAAHLRNIQVPALVVQSTSDQGVFPSDARHIFDSLGAEDRSLEFVRGAHYFEGDESALKDVVELIADWTTKRTDPSFTLKAASPSRDDHEPTEGNSMSERERLGMSDEEVEALLDECWRAYVATLNPDGSAHVVPLSFMRFDGQLAFWTDPASRKVKNLRRDPRITCLIETGREFAEFRAVQITGRATVIDEPETSRRAGETLFARYNGRLDDELRAAVDRLVPVRVAVVVEPDRVVSWDHRKLAGAGIDEIGS